LIENIIQTFKDKLSEEIGKKNIYFEISDKNAIYSLKDCVKVENIDKNNSYLIFKLNFETFNELVQGEKHPEDLLFNEKIKISGDINLIS